MHERPRSRLIACGVAVLATAVLLLARWLLQPVLGEAVPHMTFFPAVMLAAYLGGFWPGLLATLLGTGAANILLTGRFRAFPGTGAHEVCALSLFLMTGVIISGLSELLHRARRRLVAQERQRAEEALRETEERFRQLAENIHEIFWMMDARAEGMVYISPGYEEVSGRTRECLYEQPRSWVEVIHPDDRTRMLKTVEQYRHGEFPEVEFRILRPDGSVRWMRSRAFPINDPAEPRACFAGLAEDITERKHAEEALRAGEQRWRYLTESLPHLVWAATPDGACDYFSTQWTQHTGIAEGNLLGWRWLAALHPDDREPTRRFWLDSVAGVRPYDVEYRVRRHDGVYRWFKTRGVPIRDGDGNIVKWFGTCTDITDLRDAEESLRESELRFRGTFDNAAVGIAHVAVTGRFLRVNEKYCRIVGYSHDELLQMTIRDIKHPDELAGSKPPCWSMFQGEFPGVALEQRYVRKDGSVVWVELSAALQRDPAGNPAYSISVIQDISARKKLESELRQAKEAAEAGSRAKDEFLANVSHEIRTPMNAILGMTDLALGTTLTEDQRQCLRTVKSAADSLLNILNDLLDFSKIEAGKMELAPADFSLRAAVGDTLRALAARAHTKGLELVCHSQSDVPDALVGDVGRLRQVLLNLVGNAVKFTESGEVVVQVEVASGGRQPPVERNQQGADAPRSPQIELRFAVSDTGIGIPRDEQERIFRAFEQEDASTTRKYGGTGLGLTIASRLVALMGGQITVDSEPGRGSTFVFTARFGLQPHPRTAAGQAILPPVVLRDLPVLIVDDNATNRRILEEWLRGWHMKPVTVGDAVAAMDALWHGATCGRPYALVLLDARMPDVDGLALAAHIRQRAELSATPIILLTSGDRPGDLARFREQRVNAHLLKPVQQDELLEMICQVMSRQAGVRGQGSGVRNETGGNSSSLTPDPRPLTPALRILAAEDNEFNSQLLEQLLVRQGHRVGLANNGREALVLAEQGGFDLLLLDVHMPELDGFQVAQAIRARERDAGGHLPIIALTARARQEDRERCLAAGMDDFLAKPIQAANLWAAIDRVVAAQPPQPQPSPPRRERGRGEGGWGERGPSLLDPAVLLAACGGDAAILAKICLAFRARLPDLLRAVQDALSERDAPRLREAAHKLCGMLAAFSTVAGGVASELEDCAAQHQLEPAGPLVRQLETMSRELLPAVDGLSLETLRERLQPTG